MVDGSDTGCILDGDRLGPGGLGISEVRLVECPAPRPLKGVSGREGTAPSRSGEGVGPREGPTWGGRAGRV